MWRLVGLVVDFHHSLSAVIVVLGLILSVDSVPEVQLPSGRVIGQDRRAEDTLKPYTVYYGIPFATPPVGDLRFKPPRPFQNDDPQKVISSSSGYGPSCIQPPSLAPDMAEDCLHLNIYVPPGTSLVNMKKVMVYFHGGAYVFGDARLSPSSRIVTDYDVIMVSVQYRLGALGFLSTADDVMPGNNGYLDQIMALKWVKDNIGQFGGDPDDVTLVGESAGAGSASALSMSPLAKGLFTKVVLMSGTTLAPWAILREPRELTYGLAEDVGCLPSTNVSDSLLAYHEKMMECLRSKPIEELNIPPALHLADMGSQPKVDMDMSHRIVFGPVVDGHVLPKHPKSLMADAAYLRSVGTLDRSYVIGVNNNEGLIMLNYLIYPVPGATVNNFTDPKNVEDLLRSMTESYLQTTPSPDVLNIISYVYTYPRLPNRDIPLDKTFNLASDITFVVPSVLFARGLLQASPSVEVYLYLFDHYPQLKNPDFPAIGSNHGMNLVYFFDRTPLYYNLVNYYADVNTTDDAALYGIFRGALTSFAKTGSPLVSELDGLLWPRFERATEFYMSISTSPQVKQSLYSKRIALWVEFLPRIITQEHLKENCTCPDADFNL